MTVTSFDIEGLLLIDPRVFSDERGYFLETFNELKYQQILGIHSSFVQDNLSLSAKGVLRGLHFQNEPHAQGKLVQVLKGKVLDVAVDIRRDSPTYGHYQAVELSDTNHLQFWIPPGFAHGFLALEENTLFSYKCTKYYSPENERTICWNDETLKINWGIDLPIVSKKDTLGEKFVSLY
jgi:dTDP-4-dehydrorhamnose 3,5-epimerase